MTFIDHPWKIFTLQRGPPAQTEKLDTYLSYKKNEGSNHGDESTGLSPSNTYKQVATKISTNSHYLLRKTYSQSINASLCSFKAKLQYFKQQTIEAFHDPTNFSTSLKPFSHEQRPKQITQKSSDKNRYI